MTLKIAIITEIIAPYRIPVFNALARQADLDLHVIFLAETDEMLRQWRVYKNEIRFSYQTLPSWRWRVGNNSWLINRGLWSALIKANPAAIICGGYNYIASWEALLWARRRGVAFVLWSESNGHDARGGRVGIEFLKRYFLKRCDRFVVPGKASFQYLKSLGSSEATIATAPNSVDNDLFASQAENARSNAAEFRKRLNLPLRFILFVGRLIPEKGVFDLLEAYAKLKTDVRSEVGLVFAGEGVSKEELAQRARRISPGAVRFPGFVHREDLAGLYALADALILPTHSDPWGLVVNEAMACGIPTIVSSVAGCSSDLVDHGWNGYIVPPRDPDRLSVSIDSLLRHAELRTLMSIHTLERIQNYSPDACASGLAASIFIGMEAR
jgi:1,2-diacylglycerol 3-alpha-glucosyltransferase